MVMDALQSYAQLASGLTRITRERALAAARALLAQAGLEEVAVDAGERVSKLADEIVATSKANRQLLSNFVAYEVDQAVGRLGLARREDVESLRTEIVALREALEARQTDSGSAAEGAGSGGPKAGARKAAPRKRAAKAAPPPPGEEA